MVLCHAKIILLILLSLFCNCHKCEKTGEQICIFTLEMRVRYRGKPKIMYFL